MDVWQLDQDLQRLRATLLDATGMEAISLYADVLDEALAQEGKDRDPSLYWSIWQPWIGEDDDHPNKAQLLLRTVRDDSIAYAKRGRRELEQIESALRRRGGVYGRVADFLLASVPADRRLLREAILQEGRWRSRYLTGEFEYLVRQVSDKLSKATIRRIVDWLDQGPVEELESDRELRIWKYQRLDLIDRQLPKDAASELAASQAEFGALGKPEARRAVTARFIGPTSPLDRDALLALGPEGIVEFLAGWRPAHGWAQPTPEGLARELTEVVAQNPEVVGPIARSGPMLHPTYVRAVLQGVRDAARDDRPIIWLDVLGLARRALGNSFPVERLSQDPFDADVDWAGSRRVASWVVLTAFERGGLTPVESRLAWEVTKELLKDPEPDGAYEVEYGNQNMDWPTLAINTTRPLAIHAAMAAVVRTPANFAEFRIRREAQALLTERLDPRVDPSLAVRAVFGQRYPALLQAVPIWARRQRRLIFPLGPGDAERWWAAWTGYLMFNGPTPTLLRDLHDSYSAAILRSAEPPWRFTLEPGRRLAEHLVIGLARGWLAAEGGLIAQLQGEYRVDLWKEVLGFAGRALKGENLSAEQAQRLQMLWSLRRKLQGTVTEVDDLGEFGWWFGSTAVEPTWALENLAWVLREGRLPRAAAWPAADRLAELASDYPTEVANILIGLITNAEEPWEVFALRSQINLVLDRLAGKGVTVERLRAEIASRLFSQWGMAEFADRR